MKIDQLLNEHKKGVKAVKYAKKPQPLVGPEALKKKAKDATAHAKTELANAFKNPEQLKKAVAKLKKKGVAETKVGGNVLTDPSTATHTTHSTIWPNTSQERKLDPLHHRSEEAMRSHIKALKKKYGADNVSTKVKTNQGVAEGSVQDKLHKRHQEQRKKSGLPDPDYYKELRATYDLPDEERYSKSTELKKKYNVKEAKRPDRPPPKTDLKVGDHVTADTSKEDYPGGHKSRSGKVTRVGQQGVHIKTDDSDEPEWHPYKIVKKSESSMKEAKQSEAPKPRNFVAKNAKTAGAGKHKDAKKAMKDVRGQKHKNKEMAEDSLKEYGDTAKGQKMLTKVQKRAVDRVTSKKADTDSAYAKKNSDTAKRAWDRMTDVAETYDQARAARIRYALMLREGDWDQQSDEIIPPQYDMDPEELKAIRNAEFTEQDKIQAMIKLAAGGTSDEDIAKIYDMDKETVAGILDDYIEEIEAETDQNADVKEAEMGKIVDYKPGQTATLNTGPGMTTIVDLKKNPTSLTKDPATGKLKLVGPQAQGTPATQSTQASTIKPGDAVEIGKVESLQDIRRLSGLK